MIHIQLVIFLKTVLTVGFALCSHYLDFPESADALCTTFNNKVHLYLHSGESSAKILKATNTNQYQTSARECQIIVKPEHNHGVIAYVNRINLRTNKFHKCEDYVKLGYRGHSSSELCIKEGGQLITYDNGQPMIIEFFRKKAYGQNDSVYDHNFEIVLTQYKRAYEEGTFPCSNGRHIWEGLICDQKINCGKDNSDELCWNKTNIGSLIGAVIGGFLVCFVILGIWYCLRKRHLSQNSRRGSISTLYSNYSPTPLQSTVVVPVQDPNYSPLPQEYPPDHPFVFPLTGKDKS